jgi:hypothetical protein
MLLRCYVHYGFWLGFCGLLKISPEFNKLVVLLWFWMLPVLMTSRFIIFMLELVWIIDDFISLQLESTKSLFSLLNSITEK